MGQTDTSSPLSVRLSVLRNAQNADGGWGYFPGKQSWLEPTFYAALALHGEPAADRAWQLVQSWQQPDGSVKPAAAVGVPSWGAALLVTLGVSRGHFGEPVRKAADWLIATSGAEGMLLRRIATFVGLLDKDRDLSLKGWPWKPGTSSWVEPTAHAIVALRKVGAKFPSESLRERVRSGQAKLMDIRCRDGGWNYGVGTAFRVDLPSYPETTGLALLAMQGRSGMETPLELARTMLSQSISPLERAWVTIALRLYGRSVPAPAENVRPTYDLQLVALEALALPEGNFRLLRTEAA